MEQKLQKDKHHCGDETNENKNRKPELSASTVAFVSCKGEVAESLSFHLCFHHFYLHGNVELFLRSLLEMYEPVFFFLTVT